MKTLGRACLGWLSCRRLAGAQGRARKDRPNIIFIFIDDLGYGDPSCYGGEGVKTHNIDQLAADGIRFTQFYVNSPICSPSRVAVTTGQYPARHRINSYLASRARNRRRNMADFLDPKAPTLARTLQQAGYATAHFGKWHMGGGRDVDDAPHPKAYGFDESLVSFEGLGDRVLPEGGLSEQSAKLGQGTISREPKHRLTEIYVDRTIEFIGRNRNKPFYVNLWPNDVHDAHVPQKGSLAKYERYASNPYLQKFYAVLDNLDEQIGRLLRAVERLGLDEKTLIIFAGDNGPTDWPKYYKEGYGPPGSSGSFRGRKWSLYEGGIRVPFIVRWKGTIPAGKTNEKSVVAGVDLFPSVCALTGVSSPKGVTFDGVDVSRAFLGDEPTRREPLMWEYRRDPSYLKPGNAKFISPNLAIRDGGWKLLVNDDGSGAELYDLDADPSEQANLISQRPGIAEKLSNAVLAWRKTLP
ncbi:MAG: sulfatase-like hydrolase/transferase [Phycisphaerales bacterium]|nr:MAG: sulfatase-like hydrolase/transferase [Phycisphaerales bacterium]